MYDVYPASLTDVSEYGAGVSAWRVYDECDTAMLKYLFDVNLIMAPDSGLMLPIMGALRLLDALRRDNLLADLISPDEYVLCEIVFDISEDDMTVISAWMNFRAAQLNYPAQNTSRAVMKWFPRCTSCGMMHPLAWGCPDDEDCEIEEPYYSITAILQIDSQTHHAEVLRSYPN